MSAAMDSVTAFAPATVSNVACGFDVLGFALSAPGDEVTARLTGAPDAQVLIDDITGDHGRLPRDPAKNTASVAARALLHVLGETRGVALTIRKGLPLSSGLGGSAASAAAAAVAVDALLETHLPIEMLVRCALDGEGLGKPSTHIDNVAAATCGGLVLARDWNPPDLVRLPIPAGLTAVVVHPHAEVETAAARALLGDVVPLTDAIRQWANLGAFVDALHRGDFDLLGRSIHDWVAEPRRAPLVPALADVKRAAADAGALGCSISGSGPSTFALCRDGASARRVADAMAAAVTRATGAAPHVYVCALPAQGARVVSACAT
jgi:homoserine kinase